MLERATRDPNLATGYHLHKTWVGSESGIGSATVLAAHVLSSPILGYRMRMIVTPKIANASPSPIVSSPPLREARAHNTAPRSADGAGP